MALCDSPLVQRTPAERGAEGVLYKQPENARSSQPASYLLKTRGHTPCPSQEGSLTRQPKKSNSGNVLDTQRFKAVAMRNYTLAILSAISLRGLSIYPGVKYFL